MIPPIRKRSALSVARYAGRRAANLVRYAGRRALAFWTGARTWFIIFAIAGVGLIVHGVNVVFGGGWAAIAGGIFCLSAVFVLGRGMANA